MMEKHVGFTVEVLQDHGMGSTMTVTKCCVTLHYEYTKRISSGLSL